MEIKEKVETRIEQLQKEYEKTINEMNQLERKFAEANIKRLQIESAINNLKEVITEGDVIDTDSNG